MYADLTLIHVLCFDSKMFFFFKQKTAYEMRISDWSSDVCSSDLNDTSNRQRTRAGTTGSTLRGASARRISTHKRTANPSRSTRHRSRARNVAPDRRWRVVARRGNRSPISSSCRPRSARSEEHTSELQSLMRSSYAVFCLKNKKQ